MWLCRYGAPKQFAADPEFCKETMKKFLPGLNIAVEERLLRSSHKNRIVERNNGFLKSVLDCPSGESSKASAAIIVASASFLTTILKGSKIQSSVQLEREYLRSVAGILFTMVLQHFLVTRIELAAAKTVHKTRKVRPGQTLCPSELHKGMQTWDFFDTSERNNKNRWIKARVVSAGERIVK